MSISPIPTGFHSVTPALIVRHASDAIEFYKKAFGAVERFCLASPGGPIVHAEFTIGNSIVMISDEMPDWGSKSPETLGGVSSSLMLYVADVDTAFARAVEAGAKIAMPLENMFWGDRYGRVEDPFGHFWALASKIEEVPDDEMKKRMDTFVQSQS